MRKSSYEFVLSVLFCQKLLILKFENLNLIRIGSSQASVKIAEGNCGLERGNHASRLLLLTRERKKERALLRRMTH